MLLLFFCSPVLICPFQFPIRFPSTPGPFSQVWEKGRKCALNSRLLPSMMGEGEQSAGMTPSPKLGRGLENGQRVGDLRGQARLRLKWATIVATRVRITRFPTRSGTRRGKDRMDTEDTMKSPSKDGQEIASKETLMDADFRRRWLDLLLVVGVMLGLLGLLAAAVRLLSMIGHTLLIFSLGALLAYALDPLVEKVRGMGSGGKRLSRPLSAGLVFITIFGLVALGGLALSSQMARQVKLLAENHAEYQANAEEKLVELDDWLVGRGVHINVQGYVKRPNAAAKGFSEEAAKRFLSALESLSKALVEGLITALIALYFLIYSEEMRRSAERNLPACLEPYAVQWMNDVNRILGGFVRGQLILALTIGAMAAVLCFAMGIRLWLLIGLFVVVASLIPVVGPFIGAVPAVIAALISPHAHFHPVFRVVLLIAMFGIINEVGSKILYPRLVGVALGLHEVLTLFILFAGFEVGGVVGVLFAAPLTALGFVTLSQLYRFWQGEPPNVISQNVLAERVSAPVSAP